VKRLNLASNFHTQCARFQNGKGFRMWYYSLGGRSLQNSSDPTFENKEIGHWALDRSVGLMQYDIEVVFKLKF